MAECMHMHTIVAEWMPEIIAFAVVGVFALVFGYHAFLSKHGGNDE